MRRIAIFSFILLCAFTTKNAVNNDPKDGKKLPDLISGNSASPAAIQLSDSLYNKIGLSEAGLSKQAFFNAYKGYQFLLSQHKIKVKNLLTICDYSQPSNQKRLYVIDLNNNSLVYHSFVAHGHNSGSTIGHQLFEPEQFQQKFFGIPVNW